MKYRQNATLDALLRAQRFLDDNSALLTGGVDLASARKRLDDVATSYTAHAVDQDTGIRGAKGETAKQQQLRITLRQQQMEPVAVIARRNLRTTPEFASLQMPKPSVVGQAFLASTSGMAKAATIHQDTLVAHGLPSTFLDDFKAAIAKFEGSLKDREVNRNQRIAATKGLDVQEKEARTVLSVFDALMKQALADNESLFRAWQAARLIRRKTGGAQTPAVAPAPAAAPTATVASTPTGVAASPSTPLPATEVTPAATPNA
jgi:hypothetical protein